MFDREIRFGTCSAMVTLSWGGAVGLLVVSWMTDQYELANVGLVCSVWGAALLVIQDNRRTRRVVRALARESTTASVRPLRSE